MSQRTILRVVDIITTINSGTFDGATNTAIPSNCAGACEMVFVGRRTDATGSVATKIAATFSNASGVLTVVNSGGLIPTFGDSIKSAFPSGAGGSFLLQKSGTNVFPEIVCSADGESFEWLVDMVLWLN